MYMSISETSVQINGQNFTDESSYCQNSWYNGFVIGTDDYAKLLGQTIHAMGDRLSDMRKQREQLAAQLKDLDDQISIAQQDMETAKTIWQRSPFSGSAIGETKPLADLGMTDAVEFVLSRLMLRLSPTEIRDKMAEWGFDFSTYKTDEVSSISTILRRFKDRKLVEEIKEGHRRKSYKWIGKQNEHSA
jgi:hypothetical protein